MRRKIIASCKREKSPELSSLDKTIRDGVESIVLIDRDRILTDALEPRLEAQGYDVNILDTGNLVTSASFNPLAPCYVYDDTTITRFSERLVNCIYPREYTNSAQFWENSEKLLYMALAGYLVYHIQESDRNIGSMMRLLALADAKEDYEDYMSALDFLFNELETGKRLIKSHDMPAIFRERSQSNNVGGYNTEWDKVSCPVKPEDDFALRCYKAFAASDANTLKKIFLNCQARLHAFNIGELVEAASHDDLAFDKFCENETKRAVLISADSTKPMYDILTNLAALTAFDTVCDLISKNPSGDLRTVRFVVNRNVDRDLVSEFEGPRAAALNHGIRLDFVDA